MLSARIDRFLGARGIGRPTDIVPRAAVTGASTTLNLQVGAAVPVGHYTLTIRGSAPPLVDRTRTFVLTVTGPVQGTYTLSTVPATNAAVLQGGTTNVTINDSEHIEFVSINKNLVESLTQI